MEKGKEMQCEEEKKEEETDYILITNLIT